MLKRHFASLEIFVLPLKIPVTALRAVTVLEP